MHWIVLFWVRAIDKKYSSEAKSIVFKGVLGLFPLVSLIDNW